MTSTIQPAESSFFTAFAACSMGTRAGLSSAEPPSSPLRTDAMKLIPPIQPPQTGAVHAPFGSRLALLVLCVGIGLVIGWVGRYLTASDAWFLAIPLCVIVGWFAVADPSACIAVPPASNDDGSAP